MISRFLRKFSRSRAHQAMSPQRRQIFGEKCSEPLTDVAAAERKVIFAAACQLPDDTACGEQLLTALSDEARARRLASGTLDGPAIPCFTDLRIRHSGLPDWWQAGGNLAIAAPGSGPQEITFEFMHAPPTDLVIVFGAASSFHLLRFIGSDGMCLMGDNVGLTGSAIVIGANSTVMFGEGSNATSGCVVDARNGGTVAFGADTMLASGIWIMTDDTHAIRDAVTDARLNHYGGRIIVDRHVWIADQVRLMGDCFVGSDGVVGTGSFVKNVALPAGAVSVGRPARPIRSGVTWNRFDMP